VGIVSTEKGECVQSFVLEAVTMFRTTPATKKALSASTDIGGTVRLWYESDYAMLQ